ncbi:MAG: TauD/TfdA family dioxygenase [Myxococcota bacterium]
MELIVKKTGGLLGARIEGVDFSRPLTEATIEAIADALYEHQVVSVAAAEMTPEQHEQIASHFGELEEHATDQFEVDENASHITIIDSDQGHRADMWHADETFLAEPPLVNALHGKIIPESGGDTAFRSTAAAYEALSDKIKELIDDLSAIHDYGHLYEVGWRAGLPLGKAMGDALAKGLIHSHPIVRTHPVTGRKWLTINHTYTRFIEGLFPDEAEAILNMLLAHLQKPEFGYRHSWQEGDLLLWDQQAVQHYAVNDFSGRRLVHRIAVLRSRESYTGIKTA